MSPRKNGGRGLINITNHYKNAMINFSGYLLNSEEQFLKLTSNWQVTRGEESIHQKAQRCRNEIGHDIQQFRQICTYQQTGGGTQKKKCTGILQNNLTNLMLTKSDPTNG